MLRKGRENNNKTLKIVSFRINDLARKKA